MSENFSNIKSILQGVQFRNINPTFCEIVSNWEEIVGTKFKGKTEPVDFFYKGSKLILSVNVKSSPLVQEFSFFKRNILKKIKEKYNVELYDLLVKVAEANVSQSENLKQNVVLEVFDERPSEEELLKIKLDEKTLLEIEASIERQTTLSHEQKAKMRKVILNDLKTQEWMKQKGFPVCKKCGRVMTRKNFGEEDICHICKNAV